MYGSESGIGYEHATMANEAPFTAPFSVTFVRGYDMADPAVEVLRRDDVVPLSQNCCRLVRITNPGAIVEERSGEIRTSLQGQSSSAVVAA
jgi:hypothetical protein